MSVCDSTLCCQLNTFSNHGSKNRLTGAFRLLETDNSAVHPSLPHPASSSARSECHVKQLHRQTCTRPHAGSVLFGCLPLCQRHQEGAHKLASSPLQMRSFSCLSRSTVSQLKLVTIMSFSSLFEDIKQHLCRMLLVFICVCPCPWCSTPPLLLTRTEDHCSSASCLLPSYQHRRHGTTSPFSADRPRSQHACIL